MCLTVLSVRSHWLWNKGAVAWLHWVIFYCHPDGISWLSECNTWEVSWEIWLGSVKILNTHFLSAVHPKKHITSSVLANWKWLWVSTLLNTNSTSSAQGVLESTQIEKSCPSCSFLQSCKDYILIDYIFKSFTRITELIKRACPVRGRDFMPMNVCMHSSFG